MDGETSDCQGNVDSSPSDTVKVPERLLKRDKVRQEDVERRKEAKERQCVNEERSEYFSSTFKSEREAIEKLLVGCPDADFASATQTLEEVTMKTQQLQKFLNDSMAFLTQYELRQAQDSLYKLQTSLAEKREVVLPKKKFSFRSRNARVSNVNIKVNASAATLPILPITVESGSVKVHKTSHPDQCGFSHEKCQTLVKSAEEIQKQDVLLTHLTNCKVRLFGAPSSLHIKHVRDCEILCGPVSSSVFVDHCTNCLLALPCQQLRTHNTTDTEVYLHVTSRAIIEDCQRVRFAPFSWTYSGLDRDFQISGLDPKQNNWTEVDDFNWLSSSTSSPNWTVIPEPERRTSWDTQS